MDRVHRRAAGAGRFRGAHDYLHSWHLRPADFLDIHHFSDISHAPVPVLFLHRVMVHHLPVPDGVLCSGGKKVPERNKSCRMTRQDSFILSFSPA